MKKGRKVISKTRADWNSLPSFGVFRRTEDSISTSTADAAGFALGLLRAADAGDGGGTPQLFGLCPDHSFSFASYEVSSGMGSPVASDK